MLITRVVGHIVSADQDEGLQGLKLSIVREVTESNEPTGDPFVAVDTVGAGPGDTVLTALGSAARQTEQTRNSPVDAAIIAIVDAFEIRADESPV